MPAKKRVTREDVVSAALELVRRSSADALSARSVAAALDCSTQPIFSNFANMEELFSAVLGRAWQLWLDRISSDMAAGRWPPYKASGMSYIAFAEEEPNLFRLLFMRDRIAGGEAEIVSHPANVIGAIMEQTGMSEETARRFHDEMWVFAHGLAVLHATRYAVFSEDAASEMLSDIYNGLWKHYQEKGGFHDG